MLKRTLAALRRIGSKRNQHGFTLEKTTNPAILIDMKSDQKGYTLVEVLAAIALSTIIVSGIVMGITTMTKVYASMHQQEIAKDVAAANMDYIMSRPYANNYTIFNPSSGNMGTVITISAGSGWSPSDTSFNVQVGTAVATNTLTVNSSGILSGTITLPSVTTGSQTITITGSTNDSQTFVNAFNVTTTSNQYPATYANYKMNLSINQIRLTEQQIIISISLNNKVLYTLTDYRTNY
ncbi:MAG TPA: prepilin-type N-terminal cleavage/methylation domain-containing protein [Dehalococcoidales bacterium]|nr:prepilin-type N-terminal cleavage/methylation domain-containing protein [Dehalococcoidales bacterium]